MGSIMRLPSPINEVTVPLNGKVLQDNDCIVVVCPEDSTKSAMGVYNNENWIKIGELYGYFVTPSGDGVTVDTLYDNVPYHFYACFLPSPTSG